MSSLLWTASLTEYIYTILALKSFTLIHLYVNEIRKYWGFFFTRRFTLLNFVDVLPALVNRSAALCYDTVDDHQLQNCNSY